MHAKTYISVVAIFFVMSISSALFTDSAFSQSTACTHYASPTGTGNGLSQSSPFKISNFWSVAKPGHVLCLLDGTYTGSSSMITPPQNLKGTSGSPITVRALNDGKVLINGQGAQPTVMLYVNDWFVIEGINACCSNQTVVQVSSSNNNIVRRVAAWDAAEGNFTIFGVYGGQYNLLEDVAGWGIARKIYESSQGGNFTTIRRAWGRWEGSHVVGPKTTYELVYNNFDVIVENSIGTWSGERMKNTYVLLDYYGNSYMGYGSQRTLSNYGVDQPTSIFNISGDGQINPRAKLLGSISYLTPTDNFQPGQLVLSTNLTGGAEITNVVAYVPPGSFSDKLTFNLANSGSNLIAKNLTSIGGGGPSITSAWQKTNILTGSSVSSIYNSGENIFNTARSSNLCYRYQDGVLTAQPLWPWPMNQRIRDATVASGRSSVDVTATIQSMFGSIPTACKSSTTVVSKPSAPINLQTQH